MNQEFFADGISAVHVTGNLVRIDLMSLQPHLKAEDGKAVTEVSKRIIMPIDGFIQALAVQQDLLKKLIEAGIVKQAAEE